ncbi:MAG: hypothetical protein ACEPOZ_03160 [Marinifilaceae bacterium]
MIRRSFLLFLLFFASSSWGNAQVKTNYQELEIRRVLKEFYNWYLYAVISEGDVYGLEIERSHEGKVIVSVEAYFENLRSFGFISEKFISKEKERLQPCIDRLTGMDYKKYRRAEENAFQPECDCLYFPVYMGTRETQLICGIDIGLVRRINQMYLVEFEFYAKEDWGGYFYPGILGKAYFAKEKEVYRMVDLRVGERD